jgi:putative hydrolase of the HAD superfamily
VSHDAVIFDLGGVVFPSPIDTMREFEQANGLPHRFLSEVVLGDVDHGAWSRLERGELTIPEFCVAFEAECEAAGHAIDATVFMGAIGGGAGARPAMIRAIRAIRAHGLKTAALTNNWPGADADAGGDAGAGGGGFGGIRDHADPLFDTVVESAVEGLRKPDPRIYLLVCERLGIEPPAAVFLDDLGANLKPARELGMTTIKVADPDLALGELAGVLGFPLS